MNLYVVIVDDEAGAVETFGPASLKVAEHAASVLRASSKRYTGRQEDAHYAVTVAPCYGIRKAALA